MVDVVLKILRKFRVRRFLTGSYYYLKYLALMKLLFPKKIFWGEVKEWYFRRTGKKLNYRNPRDINEKLMWLSRYWQHPLKTKCADKYLVREYVKECGLEHLLIPLINVWDNPEEIDFNELPQQFVLKCNHGYAYNIICPDKLKLDIENARSHLRKWINEDFGKNSYQFHYLGIPRKIICEKYLPSLDGNSLIDYKIHCIYGEPQFFLVCFNRENESHKLTWLFYSLDWEKLDFFKDSSQNNNVSISRPLCFNQMVEYAKILSKPFPYVRVDFYESNNNVLFGELTFTPSANVFSLKDSALRMIGDKFELPKKHFYNNQIG